MRREIAKRLPCTLSFPTSNLHISPASAAANASGFLLTALSNEGPQHSFPQHFTQCAASDEAPTRPRRQFSKPDNLCVACQFYQFTGGSNSL